MSVETEDSNRSRHSIPGPYGQIILFGDSITEMAWNQEWQKDGFAFGAAMSAGTDQHVPLDKYVECLKAIAQQPAIMAHKPRLMFITPPPLDEYQQDDTEALKGFTQPRRNAKNTKRYADACKELGNTINIPVADIWGAMMRVAGWEDGQPLEGSRERPPNSKLDEMLSDGLHLNPAGYRVVFGEVMKTITEHYPDDAPDKLEMIFPYWMEAPK
ncbi:MAG: hypothetical protein Q9227_008709 [Pyrenula ochraceoflavens]